MPRLGAQMVQRIDTYPTRRRGQIAQPQQRGSWLGLLLTAIIALVAVTLAGFWQLQRLYDGRLYPGLTVAGVPVGGLTTTEAAARVRETLHLTADQYLVLQTRSRQWTVPYDELGATLDVNATVDEAFQVGRTGDGSIVSLYNRLRAQWIALRDGTDISPVLRYDAGAIDTTLAGLAREVHRAPQEATIHIVGVTVHEQPAITGRTLDVAASAERIRAALKAGDTGPIDLVIREQPPLITTTEPAASQVRAILSAPLRLDVSVPAWRLDEAGPRQSQAHFSWTIDQRLLTKLVEIVPAERDDGRREWRVQLRSEAVRAELLAIAQRLQQTPRNARFDYEPETNTLRPTVISQPSLRLDVDAGWQRIKEALLAGEHVVTLPVEVMPPRVSTADAAKIDIQGATGLGTSTFDGSPSGREQNIVVAAARFNGVVIPPGGEFSFNEHLGEVVDATGYEESYIILGDRTAVGVGGGVCQVSTTLFRAALFGGFEITERRAHGYRVGYYEPPIGLDATVYSPYVDLKFRNDTDHYYLIESDVDLQTKELKFYLYGPDTGRQVDVSKPVVLETVPHGEPIYTEDPSLPAGVTEQVDWAHDGATVKVERVVRDADGTVLHQDVFWSEYRPWVARYLVGTGPAPGNE